MTWRKNKQHWYLSPPAAASWLEDDELTLLSLARQQVNARSLSSLCDFLRERRPLLVAQPQRRPQDLNRLPYASLRWLRVGTLVHAVLRVVQAHINTGQLTDPAKNTNWSGPL